MQTDTQQPATPATKRQAQPQKTVKVVFMATGENSGTYSALCFLDSFPADKDINQQCERFVSWDCNIYRSVNLYQIKEINIPAWMEEAQFLADYIKYKFAAGLAPDFLETLTREEWNKFKNLSEKYQFFIDEYFKGNTKNPFKQSLRQQINMWLQSPYNHTRPTPLSPKQYEIATRFIPMYQAGQISTRIYNSF